MKNENRMNMIETWDQKIVMQWASIYKRLSEENYDSGKAAVGGGGGGVPLVKNTQTSTPKRPMSKIKFPGIMTLKPSPRGSLTPVQMGQLWPEALAKRQAPVTVSDSDESSVDGRWHGPSLGWNTRRWGPK